MTLIVPSTVNAADHLVGRIPAGITDVVNRISNDHGLALGLVEMGAGVGLMAYSVKTLGASLYCRYVAPSDLWRGSLTGAGGTVGALLGACIGNIGIAATGSAIGVPAFLLAGGGALVLGYMGYKLGDVVERYLRPDADIWNLILEVGPGVLGAALFIDGARRAWREIRADAVPPLLELPPNADKRARAGNDLLREFYFEPGLKSEYEDGMRQFAASRLVTCAWSDIIATFKGKQDKYESTCRSALCHAISGSNEHAFGALRVAATVNDNYARHHHIYGLIHSAAGNWERARFELHRALRAEHYPETRDRIAQTLSVVEGT